MKNSLATKQLPADIQQRQQALDPALSFAIRAPAGSGKTELLTQRFLKLLSVVNKPEEILAITFTKKAATEMQARILNALHSVREINSQKGINNHKETSNALPNSHASTTRELAQNALTRDGELGWQLLNQPARLRIQTIDALCAGLTRQMPIGSSFGAAPNVKDNAAEYYSRAVQNLLAKLESDTEISHQLSRLLLHLDNRLDKVELLLTNMLAKRQQWLPYIGGFHGNDAPAARRYLENTLNTIIEDSFAKLQSLLANFSAEILYLCDYAATNIQQEKPRSYIATCAGLAELPGISVDNKTTWSGLCELFLSSSQQFRRRVDKRHGFPSSTKKEEKVLCNEYKNRFMALVEEFSHVDGLLEAFEQIRFLPSPQYRNEQWQLLQALTLLLPQCVAELFLVFQQQNVVDYDQVSYAALQALGDEETPTDLAMILDYRIKHILIDEFQDTSSPQMSLLEKLTCNWQNNEDRSLFLVGDGMQSIYSFRDANVRLFMQARQQGVGNVQLQALDLSVNFRSQADLVCWNNAIFSKAFPTSDDLTRGSVSFAESIPYKPRINTNHDDVEQKAVEFFAITAENAKQAYRQEAEQVVELINHTRRHSPQNTIAVLVRNRQHLQEIIPALRQANISWQATDIESLAKRTPIMDLQSLTRAIINLNDRVAWLALLRAPWCGLDFYDLHAIAGHTGTQQLIWQRLLQYEQLDLSNAAKQILQRLISPIKITLEQAYRKPLRQRIEGLWQALGGPATITETTDFNNIRSYFQLLEQQDCGGTITDLGGFEQAVSRLFAEVDSNGDRQLQIMTIHKAKGLEFDTVIIPGLSRTGRADDKALLLWQEYISPHSHRELVLGPLSATGSDNDPIYDYLKKEKNDQQLLESTRLLYVACTRAIKNLYLLAHLKTDAKQQLSSPPSGSLLSRIWPMVKNQACIIKAADPGPADKFHSTSASQQQLVLKRLTPQWQIPATDYQTILKQQLLPLRIETIDKDALLDEQQQRIMIHSRRIIKCLTENNSALHTDEFIEQIQSQLQQQLQFSAIPSRELDSTRDEIMELVNNMIHDETGLWLLQTHEEGASELGITLHKNTTVAIQTIQQLLIDRTFIHKQTRWIMDYKTTRPAEGQSDEAFIHQQIKNYEGHLKIYQLAFKQLNPAMKIKTGLYFPAIQHLEIVEQ